MKNFRLNTEERYIEDRIDKIPKLSEKENLRYKFLLEKVATNTRK